MAADLSRPATLAQDPGADDHGQTEYVFVTELVDVAREHVQVSGGYEGPVLLVQKLVGPPEGENG